MNKILKFKGNETQKIDKKRTLIIGIIALIVIFFSISLIMYSKNKKFRNFMDVYLFRKNITEENTSIIEIDYDSNVNVIGHYRYITLLSSNKLKQYNYSGKLENEVDLRITTPIYDTNGRFLAVGEENGQRIYLIEDQNIVWEKEIDGNITKISVNKNGYISIILKGTTYKSVVATYDVTGKELFKTYLSNTNAVDSAISNNNKYLAFTELNTTGTIIQSNIKIISMEKAQKKPAESIIYTYAAEGNKLITKIKYQEKDKLICMYDDSIHIINNDLDEELVALESEINKADIDLTDYVFKSKEKSSGLFSADTLVEIININNKKKNEYISEGVAKSIYCKGDIIAINLGSEVEFINTSGWLIKRYKSLQEVRNVILSDVIAAVVYRDRIEIINL